LTSILLTECGHP